MKQAVFLLLGCVLGAVAARAWWPTAAADAGQDGRQPLRPENPEPAARTVEGAPIRLDAPHTDEDSGGELLARLEEIARRLDAIETRLTASERRPVTVTSPGVETPELRSLVKDVLDERRALQQAEAERSGAEHLEQERTEIRFAIGRFAAELGRELGLAPGQRELLAEALFEREERRWSMTAELDPATADPAAWDARFAAVDEDFWSRIELELGPTLAEQLRQHL